MPRIGVVIYCEEDGSCPFIDWFERLSPLAQDKVLVRMERLGELGHELRRPEADYLRDGIHELRATAHGTHHRVLYFFHGRVAVVVSHGIIKEQKVPDREIDLAVRRMKRFEADPSKHTLEEV